MQLIFLWKIARFLILKISWQYVTICSGWEHKVILFHYLFDQGAEYYIPVTNRIVLYTGEFETTAMFCTVTYFNVKFRICCCYNCWLDRRCFDQKWRFPQWEVTFM